MVDVVQVPSPHTDEVHWLTAAEQRGWRAYLNGNQQLMEQLNREVAQHNGLTLAEYRILALLSESPNHQLRMSDLADGILSSRSRLTHQIRRMESDSLVKRVSCVDDGRGVLAEITPEGMRRLEDAAPGHVEDVRRNFIDLMTPQELAVMTEVFERVQRIVAEQAD
jgi:DNA-binding MarR family transcriptional regulator